MPELPHSYAVLVLGISSIASCFCFGIVGLICGFVALNLARKAMVYYHEDPYGYRELSYNNLRIGRSCAIIGLGMSAVWTLILIVYFFTMIYGVPIKVA